MPGAVPMIQRNDKLACFEALGALDPEKKTPMRKDAIFRIYSMSKPITTAAADVKVGEEKPDKTLDLVAPRRPMTIQDLMRHTSGLTYWFLRRRRRQEGLPCGKSRSGRSQHRRTRRALGPYQPGTTWDYSHATDVLARVIEAVAGKTLSQAIGEMLFEPLGMTDTSFYLTDPAKYPRQVPAPRRAIRRRPHDRCRGPSSMIHARSANTNRAAVGCCPPSRTTRAFSKCWPTAGNSTASAI